jgi:predicted DNA-binding protein with PD1-like motif
MQVNNRVMKTSIVLLFVVAAIFLELATNIAAQQCTSYLSPSAAVAKGKAPGLTWKLLSDSNGVKEYALVFAKGDEVLSGLTDFAAQQHVASARFTAIGALKEGTFGWFDPKQKQYKLNTIHQQMELISMVGDIANYEGSPVVHAHCGVSLSGGSMLGGHLIEAIAYPTVELFMTVYPTPLQKELDPETGLKLIHPELK